MCEIALVVFVMTSALPLVNGSFFRLGSIVDKAFTGHAKDHGSIPRTGPICEDISGVRHHDCAGILLRTASN